jgi:hypothetical protein
MRDLGSCAVVAFAALSCMRDRTRSGAVVRYGGVGVKRTVQGRTRSSRIATLGG